MTKDQAIVFVICFSAAIILLLKYYKYYQLKKKMILIKCKVTDKTYRTGYDKNTYIFYYDYEYKNEIYKESDSIRFKLLFNPNIKDELNIYINPKKPEQAITPYSILINNIFLYISLALIFIPFLLLI